MEAAKWCEVCRHFDPDKRRCDARSVRAQAHAWRVRSEKPGGWCVYFDARNKEKTK